MSKEEMDIIAPVSIIVGFFILCAFNKQVVFAGRLILYTWNCLVR